MFPCEYCKIFKNSFFHRIPPVATSALHNYLSKLLPKRKFSYFVYFNPSKQVKSEWNPFKIDNKGIRKEIVKIKSFTVNKDHVHSVPEKHLKKVLDMLQAVNKETQSVNF